MKFLITGSRDITNRDIIWSILDELVEEVGVPSLFIHGGCRGVDRIGGEWAMGNELKVSVYEADWNKYGLKAGQMRNIEMANQINSDDVVIAIWDNRSRGTRNMIEHCVKQNLTIKVVKVIDSEIISKNWL